MSDVKAYLVPFSHMDLFWLGRREECLSRGNRVIAEALDMVAEHPEFRFLIEDLVFVDHFLRCHPERKADLIKYVQDGRIELGPKWAGIDQTPQVGEDLVRNSLYALEYLEAEFSYAPKTLHTGDLPGWTPQYPQILHKLGIPYAVYTRTGPTDISLFYWVGLDNSKVLVWYSYHEYSWAWHKGLEISAENAMTQGLENEMERIAAQGAVPIFVHWGVDLILPGRKLPENLRRWNQISRMKMTFGTPTEYFQHVLESKSLAKGEFKELSGEAPSAWPYSDAMFPQYMGYTLPAVAALQNGEKYAAITWLKGVRSEYPAGDIKKLWLQVLEAMDHNNNGQGNDFTMECKRNFYQNVIHQAGRLIEDSLRVIAENITVPFGAEGYPIVVFNPLSWTRTDSVDAHVTYHGDIVAWDIDRYRRVKLVDAQGEPVRFQTDDLREGVSREEYFRFIAENVPGCGYKTYFLIPSADSVAMNSHANLTCIQNNPESFTTPFYEITVNHLTGEVAIQDRNTGKNLLKKAFIVGIEENPENGSFRDAVTGRRYENIIESVELLENGEVAATIAIKGRIGRNKLLQKFTFYQAIPKIDLVNRFEFIDWQPFRLEQIFETGLQDPEFVYGVPYGANRSENIIPNCAPWRNDEMPADSWTKLRNCIQWLDISEPEYGIAIGSKHRCFARVEGTIHAVMLRAVISNQLVLVKNGSRIPHRRPETGNYEFAYTLYPHGGNWMAAKSYRTGFDFNNSLISVTVGDSYSPKTLPVSDQFLRLESSTGSLVLTVLKRAETGNEVVVRFYETEGKAGEAGLLFPGMGIEALWLCDLRENPVKEVPAFEPIPFGPFEIITVKVKLAKE